MKVKKFNGQVVNWKCKGIDWAGKSPSNGQKACKAILANFWGGDVVGEEQVIPGTRLRFDFFNFSKSIGVEFHGKQHDVYTPFFHQKNIFNYVGSRERDEKKRKFCELNGFLLIEVREPEELNRALLDLDNK